MLNSTCVFILKGEYLELSEDKDNERHMELLAEFDRRKRVMHLPSASPWGGTPGWGGGFVKNHVENCQFLPPIWGNTAESC